MCKEFLPNQGFASAAVNGVGRVNSPMIWLQRNFGPTDCGVLFPCYLKYLNFNHRDSRF